jgi:hemin uptake protein HemP
MSDSFLSPIAGEKAANLTKTKGLAPKQVAPSYRSLDLLQGQTSALIYHDQQVYTLRLTAQNKLILTK